LAASGIGTDFTGRDWKHSASHAAGLGNRHRVGCNGSVGLCRGNGRAGPADPPTGLCAAVLALEFEELLTVSTFIVEDLATRKNLAGHKPLMILSAVAISDAGFARIWIRNESQATPSLWAALNVVNSMEGQKKGPGRTLRPSHRTSSDVSSLPIELRGEKAMGKVSPAQNEMLKGTLDMMILRTLVGGDAHGHTIAKVIEHSSEELLEVEQGSLYPALHRLEDRGWVSSFWGVSENNRKAKFYRLTAEGRKQLVRERSRWRQMTRAIGLVMGEEGGVQ
jgi:PadR family transcriptional regulator